MAWKIEIAERAAKQIRNLNPRDAARIRAYLRDRLSQLDHPRQTGSPLRGSELGSYWRYRVGDYRILCELDDDKLVLIVIEVGHRSSIYRRR